MKNNFKIMMVIVLLTFSMNANARGAFRLLAAWDITTSGKCVSGWGVCYWILGKDNTDYEGDEIYIDRKTNTGYITIQKGLEGEEEYFQNSTFNLREDSPLKPQALKEFGITDGVYQINRGVYKYEDLGKKYKIFVNFTKIK